MGTSYMKPSSVDIIQAQAEATGIRRQLQAKGILADVIVRKPVWSRKWMIVITEKAK